MLFDVPRVRINIFIEEHAGHSSGSQNQEGDLSEREKGSKRSLVYRKLDSGGTVSTAGFKKFFIYKL